MANLNPLKNKSILLAISGSIAVEKIPELVTGLINRGATTRLILTKSAKKLLTKKQFKNLNSLTSGEIYDDLFDKGNEMSHIHLTRQSDLFLIAPASAESIAKLATARADNLLTATALASNCPIILAPAMNRQMYQNELFQKNLLTLKAKKQYQIISPDFGKLACNEFGIGRLVAIDVLIQHLENFFSQKILLGKKILMTVGATLEHLDPVRFMSNSSSGKMGFAIANTLLSLGAEVTLIQGRVSVKAPEKAKIIGVLSADEMYRACLKEIDSLSEQKLKFDYFFATAAVSDYKPKYISQEKIKKNNQNKPNSIELVENVDILKVIASLEQFRPRRVIGFAAETENLETNASQKLKSKNCDFIAANLVGKNKTFNQDENELIVLKKSQNNQDSTIQSFELKKADKRVLAGQLVDLIIQETI